MNDRCSNGESVNVEQVTVNQKRPQRLTRYAALSIILAAFAGLWQYGFSIGIINSASVPVKKAIKENYEERYGEELSLDAENAVWVVISASFPAGGVIGSLLVNPVVRRFGRLQSLVYGHIFTILLSLLLGISGPIKSPETIILGRIGIGITTGIVGTGITVMYIAELSPPHLRGFFGGMIHAVMILGVTVSIILGLPQILGTGQLWPLLFTLTCLPSFVFVAFSKILPESPRKLYIENKDIEAATRTLRHLRGVHDVTSELQDMDKEAERSVWSEQITVAQLVRSKHLRRQMMCAVCLASAYQLTGINSVAFNMNDIYLKAGISLDAIPYCTIGVWATFFVYQLSIAAIGGYTFLVEGAVTVAMVIWGYFFLPETRNRCFSEIQVSFHKQKYGREADASFVVENCASTLAM